MNKDQKLTSRVIKTELINWRELQFIQTDSFKELSEESEHKLKASLVSNNFTQPFYVWEDENGKVYCLDGKHRTKLLEQLISEGQEVPYLLPATFIQCDNKKEAAKLVLIYSSMYAKITNDGMFEFLKMNELDFLNIKNEIDLPDFSESRFEQKFDIFGTSDENDEYENTQEEETEILVQPGDFFQLGRHRIYCGSFQDKEEIEILMNGSKARIIFTDPPYNLAANDFTNKGKVKHDDFAMGGGEMTDDEFVQFISSIMQACVDNSVNGSIHYICMDWRHVWHMTEASKTVYATPIPKQLIVWNKDIMANGSFYRSKHELVFVFKSGEEKHLSHLELFDRIRTNVWDYPSATSLSNPDRLELQNHPTPKPVKMVSDAILDTTNENDIVVDFFLGSGTTLIASEVVNRICYASEIKPQYVQSIIKRYINYCDKNGIICEFKHLNGKLTLANFNYEKSSAIV